MVKRIFSILSSDWLIHKDTAISYLPVMIAFVNGQEILLKELDHTAPKVVGWSTAEDDEEINQVKRFWDLDDDDIPDNSVAVIPIEGVMLEWESKMLLESVRKVKANPRINAILFNVNSPGGMVSQVDLLASEIKNLGKPSVALISGMACSAAMWTISATSYRIATSVMDVVGSIGTKISIQDFSGLFDKIGIKVTDIYATKSTLKNKEFRALKDKEDQGPMLEFLDFINEVFHSSVRTNLNLSADSEVFSGDAYFAEKAKSLGLINEINTGEYALNYAYQLGLKNKIINQSKPFNF